MGKKDDKRSTMIVDEDVKKLFAILMSGTPIPKGIRPCDYRPNANGKKK